jgi:hypothetical protein
VEARAGEFVEGTVVSRAGGRIHVQAANAGEELTAEDGDALRIVGGEQTRAVGDYAVCGIAPTRWAGCRISGAVGARVTVDLTDGSRQELPQSRVLAAGQLTRLNLERSFARAAQRAAFAAEAQRAGLPPVDAEWRPGPNEEILVHRAGGWYSARVQELERDGLYARCVGDARAVRVSYAEVRPMPPYPSPPRVGGMVLVRPGAEAAAWEVLRLKALGEDETATLLDDRAEPSTRALRDVVPLGAPRPPNTTAAPAVSKEIEP